LIELTIRIVFSLLVVLALMWGLARLLRRPLGGRRAGQLEVVGRLGLSRGAAVALVRVGGRTLVLGVTDQQVSLLTEADFDDEDPEPSVERVPVPLSELVAAARAEGEKGSKPGIPQAGHRLQMSSSGQSAVAGSALSPATWRQAIGFLRERTGRRG
jgi:flagellar protein FliO/FliZ